MSSRSDGSPTKRLRVVSFSFVPGLVLGTQIAGLLFFLNPELPFSFWPVLRSIAIYGGFGGMVSLVLLLPATWGSPERAARFLPWMLTFAVALAALLGWAQASHFGYFLPPGMNARLIKAAIALSVAALVFFYTALLHSVHDRPYGPRSRIGLTLLTMASVYIMVERREAYRPKPPVVPRQTTVVRDPAPTLWVVGIDSATLDAILPLAEQGELPFFARLQKDGAIGRLESLTPTRRVALWTSLLSGRYPYRHQILADHVYPIPGIDRDARLSLIPEGIGFESWGLFGATATPVNSNDRQALLLWEITRRLGLPSGAIGWPAMSPVTPGDGYEFSERYFSREAGPQDGSPDDLRERGRLFHVPAQSAELELPDRTAEELPVTMRQALARDLWRESFATFLADQRRDVRTVFLHLPGMGEISRQYFGGFAGVHFDGVTRDEFIAAEEFFTLYYRHLDRYLESLWSRLEGPRVLAVVSAYGMDPLSGWRRAWRRRGSQRSAVGGVASNAPDGLLILAGTGIATGTRLQSMQLVDVAPTLLYALGLPIARDLDGRVLTEAFAPSYLARHPLTFVPSYETLDNTLDSTTVEGRAVQEPPSGDDN